MIRLYNVYIKHDILVIISIYSHSSRQKVTHLIHIELYYSLLLLYSKKRMVSERHTILLKNMFYVFSSIIYAVYLAQKVQINIYNVFLTLNKPLLLVLILYLDCPSLKQVFPVKFHKACQ